MFRIGSQEIPYYTGRSNYNQINTNERRVEIPLGKFFFEKCQGDDFIELGAVLPYYYECKHNVYDKYDSYENCLRVDFSNLDISYKNKNVLSISTLEHVGFNNYNIEHGKYSIDNWCKGYFVIEKIIKEAKNYLITVPIGYNIVLDGLLQQRKFEGVILKRDDIQNNWSQDEDSNNFRYIYGTPQIYNIQKFLNKTQIKDDQINYKFNNANAICVLTNVPELLLSPQST